MVIGVGQDSSWSARWDATAASTASVTVENAAQKASPTILNT